MTIALLLVVLGLFDATLAGVRAALGRDGRIDKRAYLLRALVRSVAWGAVLIATIVVLAAAAVATAPDASSTWRELVEAGRACVWVFGPFAAVTALALGVLLTSHRDGRLLASMLVFGPLAMLRPLVIIAGLAFEWCLGRAYANEWRRLQEERL